MLKPQEAQDRADALISQAKKAGADAADAIYVCDASTQVSMRLGNLEDVERSEGEEIGLRVFAGNVRQRYHLPTWTRKFFLLWLAGRWTWRVKLRKINMPDWRLKS